MNNQEAIKTLLSYANDSWGEINEAFELAIASLESSVRCYECIYATTSRTVECAHNCTNKESPCRGRVTICDFGCTYGKRK